MESTHQYPHELDIKHGITRKFTKAEYLAELQDFRAGRVPQPDPCDHTDPLWNKKYAHCLPPLECYRFVPPLSTVVNEELAHDRRTYHFGWDNVTEFE